MKHSRGGVPDSSDFVDEASLSLIVITVGVKNP